VAQLPDPERRAETVRITDRRPEETESMNMLPAELKANYWSEVEQALVTKHRLTEADAHQGVVEYNVVMMLRGVDDMLYHQNVEDVAQVIANAHQQGGFAAIERARGRSAAS
jgi:hypothetical protein